MFRLLLTAKTVYAINGGSRIFQTGKGGGAKYYSEFFLQKMHIFINNNKENWAVAT